jgi:hypothetical protein
MGRGLDDFSGVTLATDDYEPAEVELALTTIARYARDDADAALLAEAVFGKGRKARFHGDKPPAEVGRARTEYLNRVRAWRIAQGYVLTSTQVTEELEVAYVAATGDVWVPPCSQAAAGPRALRPCGTEAAYQRHKAHGEPIDEACRVAANETRLESKRRTKAKTAAEVSA